MFSLTIPLPFLDEKAVREIKKLLDGMETASDEGVVRGGVASDGEAAAYALVWEWGNARQTKKGPKTTLGINPDGEEVWLTIQAPMGYIAIHEGEYFQMIENALAEADFGDMKSGEVLRAMKAASIQAGQQIAELIRDSAPIDTGALRDSIQAVSPDDPELETEEPEMAIGEEGSFQESVLREQL